jgi:hypothetical protein
MPLAHGPLPPQEEFDNLSTAATPQQQCPVSFIVAVRTPGLGNGRSKVHKLFCHAMLPFASLRGCEVQLAGCDPSLGVEHVFPDSKLQVYINT